MAFKMSRDEYRRYTRSKEYDERVRQPALRRAAGRCENCGTPTRWLTVHHPDYFCVGTAEEVNRVRAICGACHKAAGPRAREPRRTQVAMRTKEDTNANWTR